ncbi:MAG: rhodanese-like domain-containing protein [Cyclobacteriaceae bacterium]
MGIFDVLFGNKRKQIEEYKAKGAMVIDVRSKGEFQSGHVKGSRNIPLPEIGRRVSEIAHYKKPLILCCASGSRSGQATSILKKEGIDCINGGSWMTVNKFID